MNSRDATTLPTPCICGRTVKHKGYCAGCLRALSDYGTKPLDASVLREPKLPAMRDDLRKAVRR